LAAVLAAAKNAVPPPALGPTQRAPAAVVMPQHRDSPQRPHLSKPSVPGAVVRGNKAALTPQRACAKTAAKTPPVPTSGAGVAAAAGAPVPLAVAASVAAPASAVVVASATADRRPQDGTALSATAACAGLRKTTIKEVAAVAAPPAVSAPVRKQHSSTLQVPLKCEAVGATARPPVAAPIKKSLHHSTLTVSAVVLPQCTAVQVAAPVLASTAAALQAEPVVKQSQCPPAPLPKPMEPPLVEAATVSQSGGGPAAATAVQG
ncbi:hypothetical protein Vretifemale_13615, partial [Volvox reticuliferus]